MADVSDGDGGRILYDKVAYERSIDYRQPPEPPLAGEDAAWAEALLHELIPCPDS